MPRPGIAVSLAMTVRLRLPCRTISSIRRSGVPTAMNPPTMRLAPFGIMATASLTEMTFMACGLLLGGPAAVDRQADAADLRRRVGTQEHGDAADLFGRGEFERGLLLGQQLVSLPRRPGSTSCLARSSICFCTSGVSTQPGQMALQVTPVVAVSSATTFVIPRMPCFAAT